MIYSPEIPGPRPGEARDEWEIPVLVARALDPTRAEVAFPWRDTRNIRNEIDRVCPTYRSIAQLHKKGDSFQYGGKHLLADHFPTPDGKGHFTLVDLPEPSLPPGSFLLSSRRGRQFNSMVHTESDPLTGSRRDHIFMSPADAQRLGLKSGDRILLSNGHGEFRGRVKVDRVKPGSLQGHWPEVNVLIPAGRLDASGVPDYNAVVEVVRL